MSDHTPLPWKVSSHCTAILAGDWTCVGATHSKPTLESEANAALIVRSVNSHQALLEALKQIRLGASANSFEVQLRAGNLSELVSELFTIADSAIAKAEGQVDK